VTCEQGLIRAKFSRRDENAVVFFYDPPTNETMGSMHLARDPYEKKTVELQESQIPGAGQGLFAIRDIPQGQVIVCFQIIVLIKSCKNTKHSNKFLALSTNDYEEIKCPVFRLNLSISNWMIILGSFLTTYEASV
jgi:hypothetical protein